MDSSQIQDTVTEDTPVALLTRRSRQQTAYQNQWWWRRLISSYTSKRKQGQRMLFLKIQQIIKFCSGALLRYHSTMWRYTQMKFKVTVSKIDHEIVKSFTPSTKSLDRTVQQPAMENLMITPKNTCKSSMMCRRRWNYRLHVDGGVVIINQFGRI